MHNRGVARDTCPVALQRRERDAKHLGSFALVQAGEISELDHPTGAWIDSGVHPTNQALVDTAKLHQGDGDRPRAPSRAATHGERLFKARETRLRTHIFTS
jgi:hypothetical protein